jgi:hypothetical protein
VRCQISHIGTEGLLRLTAVPNALPIACYLNDTFPDPMPMRY